jgi:hypothetical protein
LFESGSRFPHGRQDLQYTLIRSDGTRVTLVYSQNAVGHFKLSILRVDDVRRIGFRPMLTFVQLAACPRSYVAPMVKSLLLLLRIWNLVIAVLNDILLVEVVHPPAAQQ